jgi:hypothetical protein
VVKDQGDDGGNGAGPFGVLLLVTARERRESCPERFVCRRARFNTGIVSIV